MHLMPGDGGKDFKFKETVHFLNHWRPKNVLLDNKAWPQHEVQDDLNIWAQLFKT